MRHHGEFLDLLRCAWLKTVQQASRRPNWSREKEKELVKVFRDNLVALASKSAAQMTMSDPYAQERFKTPNGHQFFVDIVIEYASTKFAVESKFKTRTDGAVPDNRLEVFYDLWKCESYIDSEEYEASFFVFLTDEPSYLRVARGSSREFSLHDGRFYKRNTPLHAGRSRRGISFPEPLTLKRDYEFRWVEVTPNWYVLSFQIAGEASTSLLKQEGPRLGALFSLP
jgi:hypothetical protein